MSGRFHHSRRGLATAIAERITGDTPFGAEDTICLAAPRRTGKTTFLTDDLRPELDSRGLLTIHIDLWKDKGSDPAILVASAIRNALENLRTGIVKAVSGIGLKRVGGVEFDFSLIGQPNGPTLADALTKLVNVSGKRVVLMIDEAQHALSTVAGENAMYALKASRDTLKGVPRSSDNGVSLVLTGSHRDKLVRLVSGRRAPFLGAKVTPFPLLDRGFTEAYTAYLNARLAQSKQFEPEVVWQAFQMLGHEPERLRATMNDAFNDSPPDAPPSAYLLELAEEDKRHRMDEILGLWNALTENQRAVLRLLAISPETKPFTQPALDQYAQTLGRKIEPSSVQSALDGLRDKDIIWKSERGEYAVDDWRLAEWLKGQK